MSDKGNEEIMKLFISRYRQKIFALVLYLIGNDSNKAYEITATCFAHAFRNAPYFDNENAFLIKLMQTVIENTRDAKIMPTLEEPKFIDIPPAKRKMLLMLRDGLQALPFEEKVLLLLRDQLHLSYKNISSILGVSQGQVLTQINKARMNVRKKVEEAL
jgi:DNA-directed RNA polymerase specialized sigma24 family protein